jgi:hypothetical protein
VIAVGVYLLCAITSLLCTVMLARAYRAAKVRLLLWSAWCFVGLTVNNALLVVDRLVPSVNLAGWRTVPALLGVLLLVWGMIRESE